MTPGARQKEQLATWMEDNSTVQYYLAHLCLAVHLLHYHSDAEVEGSIHLRVVLWRVVIVLAVDLRCVATQDRDQEHQFVEDVHIYIVHIVRGVDQDHPILEVVVELTHQEVGQVEVEAVVVIDILMGLDLFSFFSFPIT